MLSPKGDYFISILVSGEVYGISIYDPSPGYHSMHHSMNSVFQYQAYLINYKLVCYVFYANQDASFHSHYCRSIFRYWSTKQNNHTTWIDHHKQHDILFMVKNKGRQLRLSSHNWEYKHLWRAFKTHKVYYEQIFQGKNNIFSHTLP